MNNQGDLISREALKEDFKTRLADCNDWIENAKDKETKIRASAVKTFIAEVILTINNAQTVEYPFYQEAYQTGYEEGKEDVIHSIATQYSEHNELVPIWLRIGDMKGGAE